MGSLLATLPSAAVFFPGNLPQNTLKSQPLWCHQFGSPVGRLQENCTRHARASPWGQNMTQDLLPSPAAPELWRDNIWDRLLDALDEHCVIPIVGPDLLHVEVDGTTTLLDRYIARRLALAYQRLRTICRPTNR